jgi:demethylmenaquinone methyltransferase/2-methoxy-6-polyprenyl-1,4-benzoquinol methylase
MSVKKSISRSHQRERDKNNEPTSKGGMAHFGYQKVPEDEKVKWVMRHFNTVARKYDLMNTLLSFGIHHLWKRVAVRMLKLKVGDWVIDVCGGTGDLSVLAARAVGSSGQVVLYDINRKMMETGRPRVDKSPLKETITYVQGNAERISFSDQRFDVALIGFGIRNLTHMEEGFKEIHRVLKPGGKLMCLEFSRPTAPFFRWLYDMYSFHIMPYLGWLIVGSKRAYTYLPESIRLFPLPEELSAILENTGFSQVTYRRLTNGIAVIHLGQRG